MWFKVAAAAGNGEAARNGESLAAQMKPAAVADADQRAADLVAKFADK